METQLLRALFESSAADGAHPVDRMFVGWRAIAHRYLDLNPTLTPIALKNSLEASQPLFKADPLFQAYFILVAIEVGASRRIKTAVADVKAMMETTDAASAAASAFAAASEAEPKTP